jgi:hypothetical protein
MRPEPQVHKSKSIIWSAYFNKFLFQERTLSGAH